MLGQGKPDRQKKNSPPRRPSGAVKEAPSGQELRSWPPRGLTAWSITGALIAAFLIQGLSFLWANSQTSDEAVHLAAGYSYLKRGDFRLNPEHPPLIKEVAALSVLLAYGLPFQPNERLWQAAEEWRIGRDFLYRAPVSWDRILFAARLPNLLLGALLVALTAWWAARLWGSWAGTLAAALAAFEPNLIANSCLVTTDLGAALFIFLTLYLLWEYSLSASWGKLAGAGAAMGMALATKYSTIILPGIAAAVVLAAVLLCGAEFRLPAQRDARDRRAAGTSAARALLFLAALGAIAIAALPSVYFFQGYSTWWEGLRRVLAHQEGGHMAFFMGEYSTEGWLLYFPVAFAIKTPIPTLLLIAAALFCARRGVALSRRDAVFLLLPVVLLFLAAARGRINIGLRHILPVYPLLCVLAGRLATLRAPAGWKKGLLLGAPVALTAASSLAVAPHQLAYFNELVGGPAAGPRYLSDSNIDWGQDLAGVKAYMDREGLPMIYLGYFSNPPPAALGIRYQYVPSFGALERPGADRLPPGAPREVLAISVCTLQAVHFQDKDLYGWLAGREPIARIGYSIYVYDLTGDAAAHLSLARTYLRAGPRELAVPELERVLKLDPANAEASRLLASLRPAG